MPAAPRRGLNSNAARGGQFIGRGRGPGGANARDAASRGRVAGGRVVCSAGPSLPAAMRAAGVARRGAAARPDLVRSSLLVFDTAGKAAQKARAARGPAAASFDYLRDEVAARVVDRLCDMSRTFPRALDLYCGGGHVARALAGAANKPGVRWLALADVHADVVARGAAASAAAGLDGVDCGTRFVFREEDGAGDAVPVAAGSLDLVVSSGGLHWVNDLPGVLARANALLRPDGLFLGAMCGGETLRELRVSMQLAEEEARGGVSPHVSPMVHAPDAGNVLQRAGFQLTTVDVDEIVVPFRDMRAVMRHLKGMGEGNAVASRRGHYGRAAFERAAEIYGERFGYTDAQGRPCVPATFQCVHLCGWAAAATQPRPRRAGSATARIGDLPAVGGGDKGGSG
jgi:NADH dehydrogenase [ubiquinone] 1 alpha subcomplex assembly factor 5